MVSACGFLFFHACALRFQVAMLVEQSAVAVLGQYCIECHGARGMGGLDLRERETIFKGGNRGP